MFRKFFPVVAIGLWGVVALPLPNRVSATTPLTKAEIQDLRNLVQLMPQHQPKRQARKLDPLIPGDGLSTGRSSLADVRFNDGSLARVGEQALFKFLPKTRNFRLSNGTILMLIPPGKGHTHINTPNAAAAIRGSALFVRYDKETDTTVVGALTNSGIQVFNKDASQSQMLQAGQLMVIVKGKFQGLYDFDLRTFYETSDLVRGLNLTQNGLPNADPAIAKVRDETIAALKAQSPVTGKGVVENPSFLKPSPNSANSPSLEMVEKNYPTNSLLDVGQILPSNGNSSLGNNNPTIPKEIRQSNPVETQTPSSTATTQIRPADPGSPPVKPTTPPPDNSTTTTRPINPTTPPPDNSTTTTRPINPTTPPPDNSTTTTRPINPTTPPPDNSTTTTPTTPPPDNSTTTTRPVNPTTSPPVAPITTTTPAPPPVAPITTTTPAPPPVAPITTTTPAPPPVAPITTTTPAPPVAPITTTTPPAPPVAPITTTTPPPPPVAPITTTTPPAPPVAPITTTTPPAPPVAPITTTTPPAPPVAPITTTTPPPPVAPITTTTPPAPPVAPITTTTPPPPVAPITTTTPPPVTSTGGMDHPRPINSTYTTPVK